MRDISFCSCREERSLAVKKQKMLLGMVSYPSILETEADDLCEFKTSSVYIKNPGAARTI